MSDELDDRFAGWMERHYHQKLAEVVARLRSLADEVEREGAQTTNAIDSPRFGWAAYKAIHAVTWGLANADLPGLSLAASEADRAVALYDGQQ